MITVPFLVYLLGQWLVIPRGKDKTGKELKGITAEKVWRLNGDSAWSDLLNLHLILGNYKFLENVKLDRYAELSTVLKFILLRMLNPIIPFEIYRQLIQIVKENPKMTDDEKVDEAI